MNTQSVTVYNPDVFLFGGRYNISTVLDLDGDTLNLQPDTILVFKEGGGFINGTIVGDMSSIEAPCIQVFDNTVSLRGTWINDKILPNWFGAIGDGKTDSTVGIQAAIDNAYYLSKQVYIPSGIYVVTRSIYVYDGINIKGNGIYNTILKTPFGKSAEAKALLDRCKGAKKTITDYDGGSFLDFDYSVGHNRFYIGDGNIGYYDSDRDTNPNHPLYYPNDGTSEWTKWQTERVKIQNQGRFVGKTGREGYGKGLIKSSQNPEIFYPTKGNPSYKPANPGGHIHSGIRNVKITDLQINTNSSDRGKDSAINFRYVADTIPANIRETYDSSVLNIDLENLYLFSIGKDAISATRAVDWTVINVYMRQCAEHGIYLDGVTSVFVTGCYANSCLEAGYNFKGVNYSNLSSCAADSCGVGYNLYKCNGITLSSCGAEATRFQLQPEESDETLYKGRAFAIRNCKGITLSSCYAMTSHLKDPSQVTLESEEGLEEFDSDFITSRQVFISESVDVNVSNCYFKCFQRIRSTPYRDEDNNKCNYQGGAYNPSSYGSRYWQVQNYLVGAQYEVRGEPSKHKVTIVSSRTADDLSRESEIRTDNLDILDPGTVPNPLVNSGYSTAGKCISGRDGNGGWYVTEGGVDRPITMSNFEFVFPINAKKIGKARNTFWAWRNSLKLVRIQSDESLKKDHPSNYYGYTNILDTTQPIDWSIVPSSDMSKFSIDIVRDYSDTSFIDGGSDLYSFGKLFHESLEDSTFMPKLVIPISGHTRASVVGYRTVIGLNGYSELPSIPKKATFCIVGNPDRTITDKDREMIENEKYDEGEYKSGAILGLVSMDNNLRSRLTPKQLFSIEDILGHHYFGVNSGNRGVVEIGDHKYLSADSADLSYISSLQVTASLSDVIAKINTLLERLAVHGLMVSPISGDSEVRIYGGAYGNTTTFSLLPSDGLNELSLVVRATVWTKDQEVYTCGFAYSTNEPSPVKNNNYEIADVELIRENFIDDHIIRTYSIIATITRSNYNTIRYIRPYAETSINGGDSNRIYSETVGVWVTLSTALGASRIDFGGFGDYDITKQNDNQDYDVSMLEDCFIESQDGLTLTQDAGLFIMSNFRMYKWGIAYSSIHQEPTVQDDSYYEIESPSADPDNPGEVDLDHDTGFPSDVWDNYEGTSQEQEYGDTMGWVQVSGVQITRASKVDIYYRWYVELTADGGESTRVYGPSCVWAGDQEPPVEPSLQWGNIGFSGYDGTTLNINQAVQVLDGLVTDKPIYDAKVCYSSTAQASAADYYGKNKNDLTINSAGSVHSLTGTLTRSNTGTVRYFTICYNTVSGGGSSTREFSPVYIWTGTSEPTVYNN